MNVKWNNKRQFSTSNSVTVQIFRPEHPSGKGPLHPWIRSVELEDVFLECRSCYDI